MKILWADKDGGPDSHVWYWGVESKRFGSIVLLLFRKGSRPVYHSHAFNSISWVITGGLLETCLTAAWNPDAVKKLYHTYSPRWYWPSFKPIRTYRSTYHMVEGRRDKNWVISLRGPWTDNWYEYHPEIQQSVVLTHGRRVSQVINWDASEKSEIPPVQS